MIASCLITFIIKPVFAFIFPLEDSVETLFVSFCTYHTAQFYAYAWNSLIQKLSNLSFNLLEILSSSSLMSFSEEQLFFTEILIPFQCMICTNIVVFIIHLFNNIIIIIIDKCSWNAYSSSRNHILCIYTYGDPLPFLAICLKGFN